jgi:ATP-binding cassette, subfamily B, bacterial HlyB/CyaB
MTSQSTEQTFEEIEAALVAPDAVPNTGLLALAGVAAYYRVAISPEAVRHDMAIPTNRDSEPEEIVRAALRMGFRARLAGHVSQERLIKLPTPFIVQTKHKGFIVCAGKTPQGLFRIIDPVTRITRELNLHALQEESSGVFIQITKRFIGAGVDPKTLGLQWFLPTLWRYRHPIAHVLLASVILQIFALATPILFQVVIDKVLAHKALSTLYVLVGGLVLIGVFDIVLSYLRTYALSHTSNRIDVELGQKLFDHMMRLPLSYFENRSAGQTVERMRELENIRHFLTGPALFSMLDLVFASVMLTLLFFYSAQLAWIVAGSIPLYVLIVYGIKPILRKNLEDKFRAGAENQQFMVESVVGIQTLKAAAVEPLMRVEWEERLAHYVRRSFDTLLTGTIGQNLIHFVSKTMSAILLLFGAKAVMDGTLSVGGFVAFNMIAGQITQPILRLAQVWQDIQQVQVSLERLGDILNAPTERPALLHTSSTRPKGHIIFDNVSFKYHPDMPEILNKVSFEIKAGEVVGLVGASGSGKSTISKLLQRFYLPTSGRILLDGVDLAQLDPFWVRQNMGIVLQDSLLFNRSIHENITLSNPALPRTHVIALARLAGADEFITRLPQGYDTLIEERGTNLSGGQRQRIALARALAHNPALLILDEATSALDYDSELMIQKNLQHMVHNRTALIIAHRLAAVRQCNRIIGLKAGVVVEQGTHDELLKNPNGLYAHLYTMQQGVDHKKSAPTIFKQQAQYMSFHALKSTQVQVG